MASKIIVGFDGSEHAHDALALAQLLARTTRAELTAACVWQSQGDPSHPALGDWRTFVTEQVRKVAEEARSLAGDDVEVRGVVSTSPARGLHDLAEEEDADLIVVGSAHSGSGRTVHAGTTGLSLLHGSPCAVAVAPPGFRDAKDTAIRVIGVGYDGSPESKVALAGATDLARSTGASLRLVAVARPPTGGYAGGIFTFGGGSELAEAVADQAQDVLDEAQQSLPEGIEAAGVLVTDPLETLADQEGLDLLAVGSRGWGPLRRVLLGSVSSHLVRSAPCPLLVFRRGAKEAADEGGTSTVTASGQ